MGERKVQLRQYPKTERTKQEFRKEMERREGAEGAEEIFGCNEYRVWGRVCKAANAIEAECAGLGAGDVFVAYPKEASFQAYVEAEIARDALESGGSTRYRESLANYARAEFEGAAMACPLHKRLRSVFLAACRRRQGFREKGWRDFFKAVRDAMVTKGLDPLYDAVLDDVEEWRPEKLMLARDASVYRRDLTRADKFAAALPPRISGGEPSHFICEGVWVQNPESVLFTDWAWADRKASAEHDGFAVVVAHEGGVVRFAVNPEARYRGRDIRDFCLNFRNGCLKDLISGTPEHQLQDGDKGWWNYRSTGAMDESEVMKCIREELEGALFIDDATWDAEHKRLRLRKEAEVASAADDPKWRLYQYGVLPCLGDTIHQAAVTAIGLALWTVIARDPETASLPGDFVRVHRQGDNGILSVWNRTGLAVACSTDPGKKMAECLRNTMKEMNEFARTEGCHEAARKAAIENHDKLRLKLDDPDGRLLRRLFETSNLGALHKQQHERALLESQEKLTGSLAELAGSQVKLHLEQTTIQKNLEFIEVFIVAFYSFEFIERLLGPLVEWSPRLEAWVVGGAGVAVALIFILAKRFLVHDSDKKSKPLQRVMVCVFGLTIALAIWGLSAAPREKPLKLETALQKTEDAIGKRIDGLNSRIENAERKLDEVKTSEQAIQRKMDAASQPRGRGKR